MLEVDVEVLVVVVVVVVVTGVVVVGLVLVGLVGFDGFGFWRLSVAMTCTAGALLTTRTVRFVLFRLSS